MELWGESWVPGERTRGTCSLLVPVEPAGIEMRPISAWQLGVLVCSKHRVIKSRWHCVRAEYFVRSDSCSGASIAWVLQMTSSQVALLRILFYYRSRVGVWWCHSQGEGNKKKKKIDCSPNARRMQQTTEKVLSCKEDKAKGRAPRKVSLSLLLQRGRLFAFYKRSWLCNALYISRLDLFWILKGKALLFFKWVPVGML